MDNKSRIKHISIKSLFGMFDQEIPIKMSDRITIIHGPNGFGKTTILNLLDALFNIDEKAYLYLNETPFNEFCVNFDDGSNLRITKNYNEKHQTFALPKFQLTKSDEEILEWPTFIEPEIILKRGQNLNDYNTYIIFPAQNREITEFISYGSHLKEPRELYLTSVLYQILIHLQDTSRRRESIDTISEKKRFVDLIPYWLKSYYLVHYIQSQRLITEKADLREKMVTIYSQALVKDMEKFLAEFASFSQNLDRTFPFRLVKKLTTHDAEQIPPPDEISKGLQEIAKLRSRMTEIDLLNHEDSDLKDVKTSRPDLDQVIDVSDILKHKISQVLDLYIEDTRQKLAIFDEFAKKLHLFKKIINSRFLFKEMSISRKDGFIFKNPEKKIIIKPAQLSSGEQHTIVLNYKLLFEAQPHSLILIDEPEISLHVAWQQSFLEDLQKIANIAKLDILIATHSPLIINHRWDLTVELKGPSQ
ncbi:MAG: AAA family ATPase [Promethearchaeota archaeon]